jgi:hypothetical protein
MVLTPTKVVDGVAIGLGMVVGGLLFIAGIVVVVVKGRSRSYKA